MNRVRKIYLGILLLIVFLISTLCFSYAFFTSINEEHGKLNIVVGDLTYKLESNDLINHQIIVNAWETKEVIITLSSLNSIDSKYELYYTLEQEDSNVRVGYSIDTKDAVLGTIKANGTKTIKVIIRNESDTSTKVNFSVIGGLVNNELILVEGKSLNQVVGKYIAYTIGNEITLIDGSKWHVLEASDETKENVVLLSDYNLNSDGSYDVDCKHQKYDENYNFLCHNLAFDSDKTSTYDELDANNIGYFIKNTYAPFIKKEMPEITDITIPSLQQIVNILHIDEPTQWTGMSNEQLEAYPWLFTSSYWLKTAYKEGYPWHVAIDNIVNLDYQLDSTCIQYLGARPTITVPKKYILKTYHSSDELLTGTSVETIDGSKWHVLENSDSSSSYVTLLSDYNLNSDGSYNTECGIDINSTYACSPMSFDPDNTNIYDETDANNIGYFIKNTYAPKVKLIETSNITLPTATQIALVDNKTVNEDVLQIITLSSNWLLTTNYWTRSAMTAANVSAWSVGSDVSQLRWDLAHYSYPFGARPVITTLKSNLLKSKIDS